MKKKIQSLLLLALVCIGFGSCIDNFEEDESYAYPSAAPAFGTYTHVAATDQEDSYLLNIAPGENGDTIVTVQLLIGGGQALVTSVGTVVEYDPVSGTLVAEGQSEFGYYLAGAIMPARIYASYDHNNANKLNVSVSLVDGNRTYDCQSYIGGGSFPALKGTKPVDVCGEFLSADYKYDLRLFGTDSSVKAQLGYTGEDDDMLAMLYADDDTDIVLYTYDAATGKLEMTSLFTGATYVAAFNDKAQLFLTTADGDVLLEQVL